MSAERTPPPCWPACCLWSRLPPNSPLAPPDCEDCRSLLLLSPAISILLVERLAAAIGVVAIGFAVRVHRAAAWLDDRLGIVADAFRRLDALGYFAVPRLAAGGGGVPLPFPCHGSDSLVRIDRALGRVVRRARAAERQVAAARDRIL